MFANLVAIERKADIAFLSIRKSREAGPLVQVAGTGEARRARTFRTVAVSGTSSPRTIRGRGYCVKNLYPRINAITLAKISSAVIDFRIVGLVEWRAADRLD